MSKHPLLFVFKFVLLLSSFFLQLRLYANSWILTSNIGYGSHSQKIKVEQGSEFVDKDVSEGPMAFSIEAEYRQSNHSTYGIEFRKSLGLSPLTSGVTILEASFKYYLLGVAPDKVSGPGVYWGGYNVWTSLGLGFASTSTEVSGSNGVSLTPKIGLDYTWYSSYFFRTQIFVLNVVASDAGITGMGLLFGLGYNF